MASESHAVRALLSPKIMTNYELRYGYERSYNNGRGASQKNQKQTKLCLNQELKHVREKLS